MTISKTVFFQSVAAIGFSVFLSGCSISSTLEVIPGINQVLDTPKNTFLLGDDTTQEVENHLVANAEVIYTEFGFQPASLQIKPNTRVVFLNQTPSKMWIKSIQPGYSLKPDFDQATSSRAGEWYSIIFLKEGTWEYMNFLNTTQTGTIIVEE